MNFADTSSGPDWATLLEKAILLATQAHQGQRQKDGSPYILHPLHLMAQLDGTDAQLVAVLHDVVEDTAITMTDLVDLGLPDAVIAALQLLTHDEAVPYEAYIRQIADNPLARRVKLADLTHNMDIRRLPAVTAKDLARLQKYHQAWQFLQNAAY
ncbi:MAG: hypothetical protein KDE28_13385 [Anaerolineales bacterium]|nr:hypothetical protein [Anaerolineales bacterium]